MIVARVEEREAAQQLPLDKVRDQIRAALRKQLSGLTPDALVEKPIDPPVLMAKIKEFLK